MSQISFFKSLPEKGQSHKPTKSITIDELFEAIKKGKWRAAQDRVRAAKSKDEQSREKKKVPAVTLSGAFSPSRKEDNLIAHSGFIALDFDHITEMDHLMGDPYTYAYFSSISGQGRVVVVKIDGSKHKESFRWLQNYYFEKYGLTLDPAPSNVASLRFVCSDENIFVNKRSKKSKTKALKREKPKSLPIVLPQDTVGEMIKEAVQLGINIAPDYQSYLKLGFAIANGFGDAGEDLFHALSSTSEKYNSQEASKQWKHCLRGAHASGVTVGSLYWMLGQVGIHPPKENKNRAVKVAALAKSSGRTKEGAIQQLVELEGIQDVQARNLVDEVFSRDDINLKLMSADPEQLIENLLEWIQTNHKLKKNLITGMIEEDGLNLDRDELNTIFIRAKSSFNSTSVTYDLVERLIFSKYTPRYNPLKAYIETLRSRCTTSGNIDAIIKTINTSTPGASTFIRKWLLSLPAAIDGHPVRSVLALTGGQNTGKTEWFRRLLPPKIKKYYAESKLDSGKDDELLMCQKLIVMDDEMGGKSKQDEKRFKELTSKQVFSLRAPYARANEDFNRLALLCGTSNDPEIVNDPTGNTRILPIEVDFINHSAYNEIGKEELFMECVRLYEEGYEWQLSREELHSLAAVSTHFEPIAFEQELIKKFFKKPDGAEETLASWFTATEIKDVIETKTRQKIMSMKRFGGELRRLFGLPEMKSINGSKGRRYYVFLLEGNEVIDNQDLPF